MAGGYGFDPSDYLNQFQPQKINPLAMGIQAGGGIIAEIAKWLGGGQARKDQKWGRGQLKGMMGKDVINPYQIAGQKKLSFMSNLKPMAGSANRRLGLDSGRAMDEMMWKYGNQEGDYLSELMRQNALEKARRDQQIAAMFYGAGG